MGKLENLQALALSALRSVVSLENQLTALLLELGQPQNLQWLDLGFNYSPHCHLKSVSSQIYKNSV
jgi:hypothetical protein